MADLAPTVPRYDSPTFMWICKDGPAAARLREERLVEHLAYVAANWTRYVAAGPLKAPGAAAPNASFFLVRAADAAEAQALMAADPYMSCGMYAEVEMWEATPAAGRLLGGKIWSGS
jgi:uncharacterized protein